MGISSCVNSKKKKSRSDTLVEEYRAGSLIIFLADEIFEEGIL